MLPIFLLYQLLLWPILITNDGTTYLSSARFIFSEEMLINYYWIREPGYPLFLKLALLFKSLSGIVIIIVQSSALYAAFFLAYKAVFSSLNRQTNTPSNLIALTVLFLSFYYISYGAIILQQSFLALFISSLLFIITKLLTVLAHKELKIYLFLYFILSAISVNFFYHYIYLFAITSLIMPILLLKNKQIEIKRNIYKVLFAIITTITLVSASYLASIPWQSFKSQQLASYQLQPVLEVQTESSDSSTPSGTEEIAESPEPPPAGWRGLSLPDPITVLKYYGVFSPDPSYNQRLLLYLSLADENRYASSRENALFLNWMLDHQAEGTFLISAGWYPFTINAQEIQPANLLSSNTPNINNSSLITTFSQLLYQLISITFLISIPIALLRRKHHLSLLLAISILSAIPYLFTVPVDRYSISIYPLMAAILVISISNISQFSIVYLRNIFYNLHLRK
jgi:hypothetical protein